MSESNQKYYPEYILGSKVENNKLYYLIKWHGYNTFYNTWEPVDNIIHCTELISNYNELIKSDRVDYSTQQLSSREYHIENPLYWFALVVDYNSRLVSKQNKEQKIGKVKRVRRVR